ncbi:hypothetical protein N9A28_04470 [Sulfurimonas sp.]|nr:hypothetical protein [Sulfurimonas sp.]
MSDAIKDVRLLGEKKVELKYLSNKKDWRIEDIIEHVYYYRTIAEQKEIFRIIKRRGSGKRFITYLRKIKREWNDLIATKHYQIRLQYFLEANKYTDDETYDVIVNLSEREAYGFMMLSNEFYIDMQQIPPQSNDTNRSRKNIDRLPERTYLIELRKRMKAYLAFRGYSPTSSKVIITYTIELHKEKLRATD